MSEATSIHCLPSRLNIYFTSSLIIVLFIKSRVNVEAGCLRFYKWNKLHLFFLLYLAALEYFLGANVIIIVVYIFF